MLICCNKKTISKHYDNIQATDFLQFTMINTLGFAEKGRQKLTSLTRFKEMQPYFIIFAIISENLNTLERIVATCDREAKALYDITRNSDLNDRGATIDRVFYAQEFNVLLLRELRNKTSLIKSMKQVRVGYNMSHNQVNTVKAMSQRTK